MKEKESKPIGLSVSRSWPKTAMLLLLATLFLQSSSVSVKAGSASATAESGLPSYSPWKTGEGGSHPWWDWKANAAIMKWSWGANTADITIYPQEASDEWKFPDLSPRDFDGFKNIQTGDYGSSAYTDGSGWSTTNNNSYHSYFSVMAGGLLGNHPPVGKTAYYYATAKGNDPWPATAADLAGATGSVYSVYIPFGLTSASTTGSADIGLDVNYTTAAGVDNVLSVSVSGTDVALTGDTNACFFILTSITDDPNTSLTNAISLAGIKSLLQAHLSSGGTLESPLYLGAVLTNMPKPTQDMGGGVVAEVGVDVGADATGLLSIPTLSEWGLIFLGLLLLTVGTIFIRKYQTALAPAGGLMPAVRTSGSLFAGSVFYKVLAVVMVLVLLGVAAVIWRSGTISATDFVGVLLCAGIVAYWVHLLILWRNGSRGERG